MEERAKQRLVGILVFVGALFLILPFLFYNSRPLAAQKPLTNTADATPAVSITLPPAQVPAPAAPSTEATETSTAPADLASPVPVQATQTTSAQTPAPTAVTPSSTTTAATTPTAVAANTSEPGITPSGLTTGESDDQPTAIQKASADTLPAVPVVKSLVTTTANAAQSAPVAAVKKTVAMHSVEKSPVEKNHALAAERKHEWIVQVGVFSEKKNAQHLLATLHQHHFAAYAHPVIRGGRTLHVVYVGPEMNLAKAKMAQRELTQAVRIHGEIKHFQA